VNIQGALAYGPQSGFPAASVVAGILVTLTGALGSTQSQTVAPGTADVQFPVTVADAYTATAVAVDANNNTFGTPAQSNALAVTGPTTVSLSVPTSIALTQTS
jgi:hypothetical protein